jgi:hypothetical protein
LDVWHLLVRAEGRDVLRGLANIMHQCLVGNFRRIREEITHPSDTKTGHCGCQLVHLSGKRAGGKKGLAGRSFQILESIGDFSPKRLLLELPLGGCSQVKCTDPSPKAGFACTKR